MFEDSVYIARRKALRDRFGTGVLLFIGNVDAPMNYAQNCYPFRQDSSFSYFFGLRQPGLAALIDIDANSEAIFGNEHDLNAEIWTGAHEALDDQSARAGCPGLKPYAELASLLQQASWQARTVHFLPAYRVETVAELSRLLCKSVDEIERGASLELIHAVVGLRQIKGSAEVAQIEIALGISDEMHRAAMRAAKPGVLEREVVAEMRRVLCRRGSAEAYGSILTKRGEVLHNLSYDLRLEEGDLVVNDSGATSPLDYASDITRTLPVGGRFNARQRELYALLLEAQQAGIDAMRPGVPFAQVHRIAATTIVEGMAGLGFFHGKAADIVESGAYAICFPHGLGHQLGLDVHDMEALGEDNVGYNDSVKRSPLFGLSNLRMGKLLQTGMVMTVEPGIYFIPALIEQWAAEGRGQGLIDYQRFRDYIGFGGMRVEDEVLVTETAARVMGAPIPKSVEDVEAAMNQ